MDTEINNFHLTGYKYLFFDIFYKNNNIYLILPIYKNPIEPQTIKLSINNEIINFTESKEKNEYEPTLIYIYNYESISETIIVNVEYNSIIKTFKLKNNIITNKHTLSLATLFKDDYKLFPIFYNYYKNQGVSHFFMYYNGKLNSEIIDIFSFSDVTLIEWNYQYWNDNTCKYTHHAQMGQIHHAIYRYGKNISEYMIFCDLDEYLYINHNCNIKNYILNNNHIDKFGFCNKWSNTIDNIYPNTFPNTFLTSDSINYGVRSKNIYKIQSINTIGIHDSNSYTLNPKSEINFIMFHFYNWTNRNRTITNIDKWDRTITNIDKLVTINLEFNKH
jgi:hypothetical protein